MKKGIHPEYHKIEVAFPNGETIEMFSSVKKNITVTSFPGNHPAWTGQRSNATEKGQRTEKFKKKYAGFGF